jgi:hypothetical protein
MRSGGFEKLGLRLKALCEKIPAWKVFAFCSFIFVMTQYSDLLYWKFLKTPFFSDTNQYYSYLPATFIYHTANFKCPTEYYLISTPTKDLVPKMTMGVSVMESPLFAIGHFLAGKNEYPQDGYSPPYIWSIYFGIILYVFIGLWFLYRSLLMFFRPLISILTVFAVFYCTNLLFYTISLGTMSHSFLFSLYSVFLFATLKWQREGKQGYLVLASFLCGLCTLIRPSDFLLLLVPAFIGISNKESWKAKWSYLLSIKGTILLSVLVFALTVCPQFIYWKIHSGHFFFDTYVNEKFYFNDPQIRRFLFSYRKGLFLYAPIMVFAFLGFIPLYIRHRSVFWAVVIYNCLNIYLLSCWWDWTYSASFGNRAMIQSFAILALPLAAMFSWMIDSFAAWWKRTVAFSFVAYLVYFCFTLNLSMSHKFIGGWLHYSDMSKEAYWFVLKKDVMTGEDGEKLQKMFSPFQTEQMRRGLRDQ